MPPYSVRVPIRFSDVDAFGVVNHARYLTYCEDSRTSFFALMRKRIGGKALRNGVTIATLECDYLRPLRLDVREVVVSCRVESLGRSSFGLVYEIRAGRALAAAVRAVLVATNAEGASRPLTRPERAFLETFMARAVRSATGPATVRAARTRRNHAERP